jgi:nicotinate-nucleotide adenylyltransferase
LREEYEEEDYDWFFITGADAVAAILSWREPEAVLAMAHLVGVTRPGHVLADPGLPPGSISLVEVPALAISSTDVRARTSRGEPIQYLVPDGVAHLIAKHRLYQDS